MHHSPINLKGKPKFTTMVAMLYSTTH